MVNMFMRSISFPSKIPSRGAPATTKPPMSHHIRSISLPCRSHPLISQLKDEIGELKTWSAEPKSSTSAWLCDGLSRLKQVHESLDDILQLPQTQESLRRQPQWVEKVLEDFLRFVDVYGIFQTSLLALKEHHSAAQVAIRRRDESKVALYMKARKSFAKEMDKLVSDMAPAARVGRDPSPGSVSIIIGDTELACVIDEVVQATKMVSAALFNGVSASYTTQRSMLTFGSMSKKAKKMSAGEEMEEFREVGAESLRGMRKKGEEEIRMVCKRMRDLENCILGLECGSEKVFRGLINTRVSLLNSLTQ